ncbi:MAG: hypothetical protein JNK33_02010 [Candidatus Doudnabacteria bacterium]|nr:hypothetical protein [Candidatus Doudnabacteria bacterium]
MNEEIIVKQLQAAVKKFNIETGHGFSELVTNAIRQAVSTNQQVQLLLFTCSTINSGFMFSKTEPWEYVSLDPTGNNLEVDLPRMEQILKELRDIYKPIDLTIIIGNTDPYYMYLRQLVDFGPSERVRILGQFAKRWKEYKSQLEKWLRENYSLPGARVVSWYQLEKDIMTRSGRSFETEFNLVLPKIGTYFEPADFEWEMGKLVTHFGPGKYFANLERPPKVLLEEWIRRKFAEYALQGKWLYEHYPNAILVQNEKPSELRSKMYQPLIAEKYGVGLPVAYFFGVDNAGYQ